MGKTYVMTLTPHEYQLLRRLFVERWSPANAEPWQIGDMATLARAIEDARVDDGEEDE